MEIFAVVLLEHISFATQKYVIRKGTRSKHLRMHFDVSGLKESYSY
jgi:hypothetical protein